MFLSFCDILLPPPPEEASVRQCQRNLCGLRCPRGVCAWLRSSCNAYHACRSAGAILSHSCQHLHGRFRTIGTDSIQKARQDSVCEPTRSMWKLNVGDCRQLGLLPRFRNCDVAADTFSCVMLMHRGQSSGFDTCKTLVCRSLRRSRLIIFQQIWCRLAAAVEQRFAPVLYSHCGLDVPPISTLAE